MRSSCHESGSYVKKSRRESAYLVPRQSSVAVTFFEQPLGKGCQTQVRIISWNCNMSFARKRALMLDLKPDILILSEVSKKDIDETPADFKYWVGSNSHKGLAVLGYGEHDYRISEKYTDELPWFIPLEITDLDLHILGLWAHVKTQQLRYVRVTHAAVDHYQDFITSAPTIMAGDFNSNTIWDKLHPKRSHSLLVEKLDELGLKSLYHEQNHEAQGQELTNTQYMYRHRDKGYHIDFAFLSNSLLGGATMEIGDPDLWLAQSDHMPIILDVTTSKT
jgi:exonuclease III